MHWQHDLSVPVHDARYDAVVIGCILSVHLPPGDPQRRQSAILISNMHAAFTAGDAAQWPWKRRGAACAVNVMWLHDG